LGWRWVSTAIVTATVATTAATTTAVAALSTAARSTLSAAATTAATEALVRIFLLVLLNHRFLISGEERTCLILECGLGLRHDFADCLEILIVASFLHLLLGDGLDLLDNSSNLGLLIFGELEVTDQRQWKLRRLVRLNILEECWKGLLLVIGQYSLNLSVILLALFLHLRHHFLQLSRIWAITTTGTTAKWVVSATECSTLRFANLLLNIVTLGLLIFSQLQSLYQYIYWKVAEAHLHHAAATLSTESAAESATKAAAAIATLRMSRALCECDQG
jgi:hypothetical protein